MCVCVCFCVCVFKCEWIGVFVVCNRVSEWALLSGGEWMCVCVCACVFVSVSGWQYLSFVIGVDWICWWFVGVRGS